MTDDMSGAALPHTITGIDPRKMLYVQNYVSMRQNELLDQAAEAANAIAAQAAEEAVKEAMANLLSSTTNAEVPEATGSSGTLTSAALVGESNEDSDDDSNILAAS